MVKYINLPKVLQPFYCEDLIRLGKDNDGGYLINKEDIAKTDLLLSFGIGSDISFEKDFTSLNDCRVEAYDKTVTTTDTDFFNNNRKLITKNIGWIDNDDSIFFSDVIDNEDQIFLKCDIDGFEFQIFDYIIENSDKFTGIVMEVHDIGMYHNFNNLTDFISKLNLNLIHLHINNYSYYDNNGTYIPNVIELTFTSSKNIRLKRNLTLPHKFDMPCNPDGLDFVVDF